MSKAKHVMVSYGENLTGEQTTVCGRMVNENGQGADCKQCAARVARNQATITAMIPTGNGLVCICDDVWADTSKVEPGTRVVCPVDGTTFEREAAPVPSGDGLACICDDVMEGTHPTPIGVEVTCPVDGSVFTRTAGTPTTPLKPITFDDVKEANGWMSTDVDAVTRTLPAGTEVKPGFWNCCQAKPAVAVQFTSEDSGEDVYYQGCRPCASTVPAECLAKLPETLAEYDARTMGERQARREAEHVEMNGDDGYREPAVIVLTGEQITAFRESTLIRAYGVAARTDGKMQLTRHFRATVAKFNTEYGHSCRTWADVRAVLIAAGVRGVKP